MMTATKPCPSRARRGGLGVLLFVLQVLAVGPALGETVDPFTAVVPVADRSSSAQATALREALRQSLLKLTGTARAMSLADDAPTAALVGQYRYQESEGEDGERMLELQASFVPDGVRRLVVEAGLPLWPVERGSTAVWIAIEDGFDRRVLGLEAEDAELRGVFHRQAALRAVPVIEPLLDLEDQIAVSAAEIWGGFDDRVRLASDRYGASYALSGRMSGDRWGWRGRWLLDTGDSVIRWESAAQDPAALLERLAEDLAERLSAEFGVLADPMMDDGLVPLVVVGVRSPATYGALFEYLESRSIVDDVRVSTIDGDRVELRLSVTGDAEALRRVLALDDALREITAPGVNELTYSVGTLANGSGQAALP